MSIPEILVGTHVFTCHAITKNLSIFIRRDKGFIVLGETCSLDEAGFHKALEFGVLLTGDDVKEIRSLANSVMFHEKAERVLLGGGRDHVVLDQKEGSYRTVIEICSSFSWGRRIWLIQEDNKVNMPFAAFKGLFIQLICAPSVVVNVGCDYMPCPFFGSLDTSRCAHNLIAGPSVCNVAKRPYPWEVSKVKKNKRPRLLQQIQRASEYL